MKTADWNVKRFYRRLGKSWTAICGVLSFCLFLGALFFDASFWRWRLSDESFERASMRVSTKSSESFEGLAWKTPILTRPEMNRRLADSALRYWNIYGEDVSQIISDGLTRWGVDQATLERVEKETDGAVTVFVEHVVRNDSSVRESDFYATQETLGILENWDDDSLDLAVAQDFLRELDDVCLDETKNLSDRITWTFDTENKDPIDSAGFIKVDDFEPIMIVQTARRASDASARLFFLLTLGSVFFSRRESVLNRVLGLETIIRELYVFRTFVNVLFRLPFLRTLRLLFTSLSRRRVLTFFRESSTDPLSLFSVVRLNN